MTRRGALSVPPGTDRAAFTLPEIVLSLAIIATAFVALLGTIPAGLTAARGAIDSTVVALVVEDAQNQLKGQLLTVATLAPLYYDQRGLPVSNGAAALPLTAQPFYRADITIGSWPTQPVNTSGLRPVRIAVSWPVDANGNPVGTGNPKVIIPFAATPLTGPSWPAIDPTYAPKIEF